MPPVAVVRWYTMLPDYIVYVDTQVRINSLSQTTSEQTTTTPEKSCVRAGLLNAFGEAVGHSKVHETVPLYRTAEYPAYDGIRAGLLCMAHMET